MDANSPQLLTLKEFSKAVRLSSSTVHRLKDAGKLPFHQPGGKGGKLLFPVNAIALVTAPSTPMPNVSAVDRQVGGERLSGPLPKWERDLLRPQQQ